jgi:hypothetical protein
MKDENSQRPWSKQQDATSNIEFMTALKLHEIATSSNIIPCHILSYLCLPKPVPVAAEFIRTAWNHKT